MVFKLVIFKFLDSTKSVRELISPLTSSEDIRNLSPSFLTSLTWEISDKLPLLIFLSKLISTNLSRLIIFFSFEGLSRPQFFHD